MPGVAHAVEHRAQLVDRRADAGEVRHRLQAVVGLDARDDVDRLAALGGRAAGAVGDRDERRLQPRELGERAWPGWPRRRRSWAGRTRTRRPARPRSRSARRCASRAVYEASAQRSAGSSPSAAFAATSPSASRWVEPGARHRHLPARQLLGEVLAVDRAGDLVRGRRPVASAPRTASRLRATSSRLASMWPATSVNGRAWPASASRASSALDDVERVQELADRVRRVADVEVLRDAAEQVVAGDQQPLLGLVQADVRRRVAGRLDHLPGAGVGLDPSRRGRGPGRSTASPAWPVPWPRRSRPSAAAAPPARRSAARPRSSVEVGRAGVQLPGRMHPDLAAGALGDRRRLPAVVDVGVGDHDQLDVADPEAGLARARARGCPSSRGRASRCRRARSRRRPSAPTRCSAGRRADRAAAAAARRRQHALAAAEVTGPGGLAVPHGAGRYRPGDGEEGPPQRAPARPTANTATSTARCSRCAAR